MSKINILFCFCLFIITVEVVGQNRVDTINVVRDFGTKYYQNDYQLNINELFWVTKYTPEMDDAKRTYRMGVLLSSIGGFLIGYPIGQYIGGDEAPIWEMGLVGVGITAISMPIFTNSKQKALKGIKAFNKKIKQKKALK